MTTDNDIDQDQQDIDTQQGIGESGNDGSQVQMLQQQLAQQDQQLKQLSGMVNASRGHVDRSLNAIRNDNSELVSRAIDQRLASMNDKMQQDQLLDNLDENQRGVFQHVLNKLDRVEASRYEQQVPQQGGQQVPQQGGQDPWLDIYDMVSDMGVDRSDSRIQYALLLDESVDPRQRQANFFQNIMSVRDTSSQAQPQSEQRQPSANPPVESMSPSTSTAFRNSEDIRDAYIAGKITTDVYHERMRAIGEDI